MQNRLHLMLGSSSPGILDGDDYDVTIMVGAKCNLELETQSYQRLFNMYKGAKQTMNVVLHAGASFVYLPHPVVPHEGAIFLSKTKLNLHAASSLLWGEIMSCGRKLNGEVFKFTSYHSLLQIFQNDKLVVKENILLKPAEMNLSSIGHFEGFTHHATLIFINNEIVVADLISLLVEMLCVEKNIAFGVSALPVNGIIIRLLGYAAEHLFELVKTLAYQCESFQTLKTTNQKAHV
ncbi:MAG: urease accessory protein UreD [Bacteroidota bacterium]|nr:urease accessory protein UreD [Bacteroidota bacterium]